MAKIILIDDEAAVLKVIRQLCDRMGHETFAFQTGAEGMRRLHQNVPDILIVDMNIGDMNGLDIIRDCHHRYPLLPVIMVTGYGTVRTAVDAMRLGAFDYLSKPFDLMDLQRTIARALGSRQRRIVDRAAVEETASVVPEAPAPLIGKSDAMGKILQLLDRIAYSEDPVLLEGEFGSGKMTLARAIHQSGPRAAAPFRVLHCSALPEDMLEEELFTGSRQTGETILTRSQGGTLVLDEINALPPRIQSQLDTLVEDLQGRRAAGSLPESLDVRLVATSTGPLEAAVRDGEFREDLFYSVSVVLLTVPPLRQRQEDIPLLAQHFLEECLRRHRGRKRHLDKYSLRLLSHYAWPGNVSELANAIARAFTLSEEERIRPSDLPPKVAQQIEVSGEDERQGRYRLPIGAELSTFIRQQERLFIQETLRFNGGSREKTAGMLGVSMATLYRKMGIKAERPEEAAAT